MSSPFRNSFYKLQTPMSTSKIGYREPIGLINFRGLLARRIAMPTPCAPRIILAQHARTDRQPARAPSTPPYGSGLTQAELFFGVSHRRFLGPAVAFPAPLHLKLNWSVFCQTKSNHSGKKSPASAASRHWLPWLIGTRASFPARVLVSPTYPGRLCFPAVTLPDGSRRAKLSCFYA
ncbi:hypothetical protein NKDENANG_03565 [Candidatus Entotheonellaceae bacterium PAL068K]